MSEPSTEPETPSTELETTNVVLEDETQCITVSSRGILKSTDIHSEYLESSISLLIGYDFSKITADKNIVYVCSTALPFFWKLLPTLSHPIVLVSGDCDICSPTDLFPSHIEFQQVIDHPNLIHWFSQNCSYKHPKLTAIPIGLDYHTLSLGDHPWGNKMTPVQQENQWKTIARSLSPIENRKLQCYANFQFAMTTRFAQQRHDAIAQVNRELVFYEPVPSPREAGWRKQGEYAFVLSPSGNGYDCHRTWEALCLGCIPIVFDTPINHVYHGLPVWIVKSWKEITKENMIKKIIEYKTTNYQWEKMRLDYWMNNIRKMAQSTTTTTTTTTT